MWNPLCCSRGLLIVALLTLFARPSQTGAQTCVVIPSSGPFAGANVVSVTNTVPPIGNGLDITRVTVGGVSATYTGQGTNWVTITVPATGSAGAKDVVIQSTSIGTTTFAGAYTVNPTGQIGSVTEDWTQWQEVAGLPAPRWTLAAAVLNGALYAFGGYGTGYDPQSTVYRYDGLRWTETAPMPAPTACLAATVLNGVLYAIGGIYSNDLRANVYAYDGTNWTAAAALPAPRGSMSAGVLNGNLFAMGGANGTPVTNVYLFGATCWTNVPGLPAPRSFGASGVLNGSLYFLGGDSTGNHYDHGDVYRFDGSQWTAAAGMPVPREGQAVGTLNGTMYAVGCNNLFNVLKFDGTNWTYGVSIPAFTTYAAAGVLNGALYVIGGRGSAAMTNVYRYPRLATDPGVKNASGSYTGGYPVVITGTNLGSGADITNVTLCGASAANIVSQSATQVVVTAGTGNPGVGDVRVWSASYGITTKSNAFTYNPAISAAAGPGGTVVPSGTVDVVYGGTTSFVVRAATYYHIASLLTNGTHVAATTNQQSYTSVWMNVTATGALAVAFAENRTANAGTPQWWLAQYGWTNDFEAAATNDADGDGMPNWAEYVAGTDPTNRNSLLTVSTVAPESDGTGIVVRWQSTDGKLYSLQRGTNLTDIPPFGVLVRTNIPALAPMNTETDNAAIGTGPWYYRVMLEP